MHILTICSILLLFSLIDSSGQNPPPVSTINGNLPLMPKIPPGAKIVDPKAPIISTVTKNLLYCTVPVKETGCSLDRKTVTCITDVYANLICSEKTITDVNKKIKTAMMKCIPIPTTIILVQRYQGMQKCFASAKKTWLSVAAKIDSALAPILQNLFTKVKSAVTQTKANPPIMIGFPGGGPMSAGPLTPQKMGAGTPFAVNPPPGNMVKMGNTAGSSGNMVFGMISGPSISAGSSTMNFASGMQSAMKMTPAAVETKCGSVAMLNAEYNAASKLVTQKLITDFLVAAAKTFDCPIARCINQYFNNFLNLKPIIVQVNQAKKCNIK